MPKDPLQSFLNNEVAKRDTVPPFVAALSHDELAARHVEHLARIDRLIGVVEYAAGRLAVHDEEASTMVRRRLQGALQ